MSTVDRPEFAEATRALRDALVDVIECHQTEDLRAGHEPPIGSPAATDDLRAQHYAAIEGSPTKEARLMGGVQLSAATEMIRALLAIYESDVAVVAADKVLVRSVLESTGRSAWLLDPTLDTHTRVARGLVERFEDLRLQRRILPGERGEWWQKRIEALERQAKAAGFNIQHIKNDATRVGGTRRLTSTEAVETILGGRGDDEHLGAGTLAQRYLSLATHGNVASMLLHRGGDDELVDLGGGVVGAPMMMTSNSVNQMVAMCGLGYLVAVNARRQLMGWRDPTWGRVIANFAAVRRRVLPDVEGA